MAEKDRNREQQSSKKGPENAPDYPLDEREYQDKDGETHHHTNVWMSRHSDAEAESGGEGKGGGSKGGESRSGGQGSQGGERKGGQSR